MSLYRQVRARLHPFRVAYVATVGQGWKDAKDAYQAWRQSFTPGSGPLKQKAVRETGVQYRLRTLVETGTFRGEMVTASLKHFDRIYSIELAPALAKRAQHKFRWQQRVTILEGDSAKELPVILASLTAAALFWLDGHFSGDDTAKTDVETPVREELRLVLSHPFDHVILIDDARAFDGSNDYPTLDELRTLIAVQGRGHQISIEDDIIRIIPERFAP